MAGPAAGLTLAGRFHLTRPLGRGGMGEVWLADDRESGEPVALKFLAAEFAASPAAVAALQAECQRARRLVHPNIVRVLDYLEDGPDPFIAMQYVAGASAGSLRGKGYREILAALGPIADALAYAHREGVIHRDLKPSNILRDARGNCLLADFGVANVTGAAAGSLPAMSPQQLAGEPPSPADDVYGFGALLWDLLAGQPLFHPVTPERINTEVPAPLIADLTGEPLPGALTRLIRSLLEKSPARRPVGLGAVRAAMDEILKDQRGSGGSRPADDGAAIRPLARGEAAPVAPLLTTLPSRPGGLPGWLVWSGLAALLAVAGLVIFYLPTVVRNRGPLVAATADGPPGAATSATQPVAPTEKPGPPVTREAVDQVLADFLPIDDALRKSAAERWGGADWTELRRQATAGDDAFRTLDFAAAVAAYRPALDLARKLQARVPVVLQESLRAGNAALAAGDQQAAVAQFELALAIEPTNAVAGKGLDRARKLDQVLALVSQAAAAESAGSGAEALRLYRAALAVDPAWAPAVAATRRLEQAAATDQYQTRMAQGFAAVAGKDLGGARTAFEAALKVRPGDNAARTALADLDTEQKQGRVLALQDEARNFEAAERWSDAARSYAAALAQDATLLPAQEGLARSRQRADLDMRLRKELGNADRFNDPAVYKAADVLLVSAKAVAAPGPLLRQQVDELARLLAIAATDVTVNLESDNLTVVVIYKVGNLGTFTTKSLQLRPGAYIAVGSRPGYRDVRRNFRVTPDGRMPPVVVRCEETI